MNLSGSLVALITPMTAEGAVDYETLERLIEHHIQCNTHGIVPAGTTGEASTLSPKEHLEMVEATIKFVNKRVPVIAGTGANSTSEAIYLTQQAYELGADAALLVVPYYNKPNQDGLYQHYRAISEAVPIPQVLYNVPGRTITDLANETITRLADIDNIVGLKDATGDLERGKKLIDLVGDKIAMLSGDDPTALAYMKLGARGDISVTANVAPALMSQMCELALAGKFSEAEALDVKLTGLHTSLFVEANPIPVKYAVHKLGFGADFLRLPLTSVSPEFHAEIESAMSLAEVTIVN